MEPGGDLLRLMLPCCHPVLSVEARAALTLRLVGGLTTEEIARGFLDHRRHGPAAHRARQAHARRQRMCRSSSLAVPTLHPAEPLCSR